MPSKPTKARRGAAGKRVDRQPAKYLPAALVARDQEIKDKSLALAERKFQVNAARAALREAGRLKEIQDEPEDEQAKIDKVMLLLFGPEPDGFAVWQPGRENQ